MKKALFLTIFLLSLIAVIYGCTNEPKQVSVQENITEVKVIASCDDSNPCTEDIFNDLTKQCDHKKLDHCCGDKTCDSDERCNQETHKTICPQDCPQNCPGVLTIEEVGCEGNCIKGESSFLIDGDSKIKFQVKNIGELSVNEVKGSFKCTKPNENTFVGTNFMSSQSGVTFTNYFNKNMEKIDISGAPYGKDEADYSLEIKGKPTEEILLNCKTEVGSLTNTASVEFKIKLSSS